MRGDAPPPSENCSKTGAVAPVAPYSATAEMGSVPWPAVPTPAVTVVRWKCVSNASPSVRVRLSDSVSVERAPRCSHVPATSANAMRRVVAVTIAGGYGDPLSATVESHVTTAGIAARAAAGAAV